MINFSTQKRQAKQYDERDRMTEAVKALDYYNNRQLDYLLDCIAQLYPNEKDVMQKYAYALPLTKSFIHDIAILFQETAEILPVTEDKQILEKWQEITEECNLHPKLLQIDRMVELFTKVGVCVRWHSSGYIILDILTPDRTIVEQDSEDHSKAIKVWYLISQKTNTPQDGEVCTWAEWTAETYREVVMDSNFNVKKQVKSEPNPYGRIPISWFTNNLELDEFWHDSGYPVIDTNEAVNIRMSNLMLAMDYQTVSLLVTTGLPESQSIPVGVTQRLNIPPGVTGEASGFGAEYITPSPLLKDVWDLVNQFIVMVARLYNLSAQSINRDSASFPSGYQLKLSKQDIVNYNKTKKPLYRKPVKDLCRDIADCYSINSKLFTFGQLDFTVDFADVQFETNPIEQAQLNAIELGNGITSEVQILMDRNPD